MLVNPESPDLLLPYMHGTGGRLIIHLVMLSPEVHTWSAKVEEELLAIPVDQHVAYKLEYIKRHVFPMVLKDRIEDWKKFEPQPWGLTFPKTKKFIRHAWMKESLDDLLRFRCDKIAYTDFTDCLYFAIRAVIAKNTCWQGRRHQPG